MISHQLLEFQFQHELKFFLNTKKIADYNDKLLEKCLIEFIQLFHVQGGLVYTKKHVHKINVVFEVLGGFLDLGHEALVSTGFNIFGTMKGNTEVITFLI